MKNIVIEWVTMTKFAKELGISNNTFKEEYLGQCKPQRKKGCRLYWTRDNVEEFKKQLQQTEID